MLASWLSAAKRSELSRDAGEIYHTKHFWQREYSRFGAEFGSQTNALLHIDDVAVLGEPVDKGGCQVSVLQKETPLAEAQIGSD